MMSALERGIIGEHGEIASLIANLRRRHAEGLAWTELALLLDQLVATVASHFESEEKAMAKTGYPGLDEHRANHETFLRRLRVLRDECDRRETELMAVFMDLLENWSQESRAGGRRTHARVPEAPTLKRA